MEPPAVMSNGVAAGREVDEDLSVAGLRRERLQVVGPLVEGAAGGEVEARVVPVAGEDAVLERAAVDDYRGDARPLVCDRW